MRSTGTVVTMLAAQPGSGATFVAVNLAAAARQHQQRALLVDAAHPWPGDQASRLGMTRPVSLASLAARLPSLTAQAFADSLNLSPSGISLVPFINDEDEGDQITPETVQILFKLATMAFQVVIVDAQDGMSPLTPHVLERSNLVCIVTDGTARGVSRANLRIQALQSAGIAYESRACCVNRSVNQFESSRLRAQVLAFVPDDLSAVKRGAAVVDGAPESASAKALMSLWFAVTTHATPQGSRADRAAGDHSNGEDLRTLKESVRRELLDRLRIPAGGLPSRDPEHRRLRRDQVQTLVERLVDDRAESDHEPATRRRLIQEIVDAAVGFGPFEPLLADPEVTEIMANGHDRIYVERRGALQFTGAAFTSEEALRGVIERIVSPLGRRVDERVPMVDARLEDGSRVNVILRPLARHPTVTIRKFSARVLGTDDLLQLGSVNEAIVMFLKLLIAARKNIVISGGTGSGKTTLLNCMGSLINRDERIITIEDAAELRLPQPHVVSLEARPANLEGEGAITHSDLLKNALRMRPDRIIVGECRGGEALDMLQAMNTGHDGGLTTVHANSPEDALRRIETLSLMSGLDLPVRAIRDQIASAIDFVIQQSRLPDGRRCVTAIAEINGQTPDGFRLESIFEFERTRVTEDGTIEGRFLATGYRPPFVDVLMRQAGISVPLEIFRRIP
jgi:pilus assembly protein CpaF